MSTSPTPRPHRRVRSVPIHLNFQITPVTSSRSKATFAPTSGTATPSSAETPNGHPLTRARRSRRSSGTQSPAHPTAAAYEDHPSLEMKRSTSTFFLSSLPSYRHDWTYRHGARVTAESLEEQGRSWLVTRASSTDLAGQTHHDSDEEEIYHRQARDLEILDLGETLGELLEVEAEGDEEEFNWTRLIKTFLDFGDEDDDDIEQIVWTPPRKRTITFADNVRKDVDENIVQRARERDEDHGMDGWMDGAAYLAFLGVRAIGGFF